MRKILLTTTLLCGISAQAQVTLFQDNFESGTGSWTLNGGTGNNQWMANNEYTGYPGFIDDTPTQPGSFTNGPMSTYLHITNNQICGALDVCNANFDTGSSSNQSATMTTGVNTTGFANVSLEFYYVCDGAAGISYGIVEFSTDNGSTWTAASGQYSGVTTWTMASITANAAFNNQTSLKFRFRWQNGGAGSDPAFSIDEVKIVGEQGNFVNLSTGLIGSSSFCTNASANITVPFTATGTVNAGNNYIAQLSNASGSFASPTDIGSLASNSTGSLSINAVIPSGLPAGNNYQIRVVATDPASTGSTSTTILSVNTAPNASIIGLPSNGVICEGESITLQGNGGATYAWSPTASLDNPNLQTVSASPAVTTVYTATVTGQNGCVSTATFTVTVDDCAAIGEQESIALNIYPNPASEELFVSVTAIENVVSTEVVDLAGRTVKTYAGLPNSISVSDLPNGTFVLKIQHAGGTSTATFVKN